MTDHKKEILKLIERLSYSKQPEGVFRRTQVLMRQISILTHVSSRPCVCVGEVCFVCQNQS